MDDSKRFLVSNEAKNPRTIFVRLSKSTTDIETDLLILCTEIESLHRNPITDEVIIGFQFLDPNSKILETRWNQAILALTNAGWSRSDHEFSFWAGFERV
jgi:hypothetical protein